MTVGRGLAPAAVLSPAFPSGEAVSKQLIIVLEWRVTPQGSGRSNLRLRRAATIKAEGQEGDLAGFPEASLPSFGGPRRAVDEESEFEKNIKSASPS